MNSTKSTIFILDFDYDSLIVKRVQEIDRRLKMFGLLLRRKCQSISQQEFPRRIFVKGQPSSQFSRFFNKDDSALFSKIDESRDQMLEGVADDFDLRRGLDSLLDLMKAYESSNTNDIFVLKSMQTYFYQWLNTVGLNYDFLSDSSQEDLKKQTIIMELLSFRDAIRNSAVNQLKTAEKMSQPYKNSIEVLEQCDRIRDKLKALGLVVGDSKT